MRITYSLPLVCVVLLFGPMFSEAATCYSQTTYYSQSGYYGQSAYLVSISTSTTFTGTVITAGGLQINNVVGKGGGTFVIDHPLDPKNKLLYHSFVESPDVKNLYDGIVTLDGNGEATITLPRYFEALNEDFRYQLKPLGEPMRDLYVKREVMDNRFTIGGGKPNGRVSWQVTGIRHDPYIIANPVVTEVSKGPNELVLRGEMLFEEHPARGFPTRGLVAHIRSLFVQ